VEYFKTTHDGKAYKLVHCWRVLKDFEKWRLTYSSYKKFLKNGKAPATVDLEEEAGDKGTLPHRPRGHKAKASDIKRNADALPLSNTVKGWMAKKEKASGKSEEKRRREKEATCNNSLTSQRRQLRLKRA
jgi:hypothetical protein